MEAVIGRLPTIPEYYREQIDREVDLLNTPKQCCPFHKEDTPSFSYSAERGIWRCFGACKAGGDVIELHRLNYKLRTREEAEKSLKRMYQIPEQTGLRTRNARAAASDEKVGLESAYARALALADRPERWLTLDYVMSKTPVDETELLQLLEYWAASEEG